MDAHGLVMLLREVIDERRLDTAVKEIGGAPEFCIETKNNVAFCEYKNAPFSLGSVLISTVPIDERTKKFAEGEGIKILFLHGRKKKVKRQLSLLLN